MQRISPQHGPSMFNAQQGMTLIELLVAMALGLLITLAAAAALLVSRQGFFAVDAGSQLRDNARYAQDILQRVGIQAGYRNVFLRTGGGNAADLDSNPPPSVYGLNNRQKTSSNNTWDGGAAWGSGTANVGNNSDILILRAQTSTSSETATVSDGTMIDCLGLAPTAVPTSRDDRFISILHVQLSNGEPSLMCTREAAAGWDTQPLIQGVESFQVLYGVDTVGSSATVTTDSVPDRYLRADQVTVAGNEVASYANWRRVRSLRIGMVLRSQAGSGVDSSAQTYYPLGTTPSGAGTAQGSGFSNSNDAGSAFTAPEDRRMRQVVTFTVHLRNFQGIETN